MRIVGRPNEFHAYVIRTLCRRFELAGNGRESCVSRPSLSSPLLLSMGSIGPVELEALLERILSNDNSTRRPAEELYNTWKNSPDQLLLAHVHLIRTSPNEVVRATCLVLLRTLLLKAGDSVWPKVTPQVQQACRTELLHALTNENVTNVRRKLNLLIADFGAILVPKGLLV